MTKPRLARMRLRVGDVFTIPVTEEEHGFGQVAGITGKRGYLFGIFRPLVNAEELADICEIALGEIVFLALSFDALLRHRVWKVVANCSLQPRFPFPVYRVHHGEKGWFIQDYSGRTAMPVPDEQAAALPQLTYYAPMVLQKALRALHGYEAWRSSFDAMRPGEHTEARYFGASGASL